MRLYKTTIKPKSSFGSKLKGDTFFGQICWMIRFKYGEDRLSELLNAYKNNKPFLVISDAFAKGYLPKPKMPTNYLHEDDDKKKNRKKVWLTLDNLQNGEFNKAKRDDEVYETKDKNITVIRNSINYLTFTTDGDKFAPYGVDEYYLNEKDIYFLLDEEQFSLKELKDVLSLFSELGYGKDTTIGKGRFEFSDFKKIEINIDTLTYMSLSPFVIEDNKNIEKLFYEPFVRFGKFGFDRAHKNAFKNPILMIDSASVVVFKEKPKDIFFGRAITNISKAHTDAIHQGYSILLPIKDIK